MRIFIISASVLLLLSACSKKRMPADEAPGPLPDPVGIPIQTARGATTGPAVSAAIGAGGGTLASADGRITLTIPAGALAAPQTFSIQPVENSLRRGHAGATPSFRLLPENVNFAKPVIVKLRYDPAKLTSGVEDGLRMAYQTATGQWKSVAASLDKASRTLTASVTHFSDYTFYEQFELFSDKTSLGKKEEANLCVAVMDVPEADGDVLWPRSAVLAEIFGTTGKFYSDIGRRYIDVVKDWKIVSGGGTLTPRDNRLGIQANALYVAPDNITKRDSAIVEVTLQGLHDIPDPSAPGGKRKLGTLILRKTIYLEPDSYIQLSVNGKDHLFSEALSAQVADGAMSIGGNFNKGEMGISIDIGSGKPGTFSCDFPEVGNRKAQLVWTYKKGDVTVFAGSMYCVEEGGTGVPKHSAGTVKVSRVGAVGEMIEGEFSGTLYEQRADSENCDFDHKQVAIRFRVRRTQ